MLIIKDSMTDIDIPNVEALACCRFAIHSPSSISLNWVLALAKMRQVLPEEGS